MAKKTALGPVSKVDDRGHQRIMHETAVEKDAPAPSRIDGHQRVMTDGHAKGKAEGETETKE